MLHTVHALIKLEAMLTPGAAVVVGVSGGLDSMVLLHALQALEFQPLVVHVNYQLRGAAADADEALVDETCRAQGLVCHTYRVDAKQQAKDAGTSFQEAARDIRYAIFDEVARAEKVPVVAVAHHQDDQAETVLLNLFRGTGMDGLAGMRPKRPLKADSDTMLIRPLLHVNRQAIRAYAEANKLHWRDDASNSDTVYARNRLRHSVLPLIKEHFGASALNHIAQTASVLQGYNEATLKPYLAQIWADAVGGESQRLACKVLSGQPSVWRKRLILEGLRTWLPTAPRDQHFIGRIVALLDAEPGKRIACKGGTIWRARRHLVFEPTSQHATAFEARLPGDGTTETPAGTFSLEQVAVPSQWSGSEQVVYIDADAVMLPLRVRFWQHGDRLQPLGMMQTKLVSDLLTDAKVPVHLRERVLVVVSGDELVWVVGQRIGHRFRITEATRRAVKMVFVPANS